MVETFNSLLEEWYGLLDRVDEAKALIARELELRKKIVALGFHNPKEGVNYRELGAGYQLKVQYKLDRKIDEAAYPSVQQALAKIGFEADNICRFKREIDMRVYRDLTADVRNIFDDCLEIKPGSPILDIVAPKEKK